VRPVGAVARRALADARIRTGSFALFFGLLAYAQAVGYGHSFPTLHDRLQFARSFGDNAAVRMFYGTPHDLLTVGGYCAWRVGGILSLGAAIWALLAAVRALRAEEDAGRQELVLAGVVSRRGAFLAALAAIAGGAAILWIATFAGLAGGGLPVGGSAYLALAIVAVVPVFAGIGALACQLAPTRRVASGLASAVFAIAFAMRVVADTSSGLSWLRWATPLGWVEELRAFTGPRPVVLLLALLSGAALLVAAGLIAMRRDVGSGLLPARDTARPRLRLLTSPTALALREARGSLVSWLAGIGAFAFLVGMLSTTVTNAGISSSLKQELHKVGGATIATPSGYIGLTFLFFVLALSLFACSLVAAARREEADQRLETLLALPTGRSRWLGGRLALATAAAAVLALAAGALAWAGAASQHAGVSLARMLEAGANCLPAALLFGALGALAFATLPRASTGIAYGLVSVAFAWELLGALLGAPGWTLGLSPFHHVGLVPAQPFQAIAALVMLAAAAAAAASATWAFRRRDLSGA
jgi:ABC-2 type transport system permease protein